MFGKNINYFANDKTNLETYFVPNQQINKENLFTSIKNIIKNLPKVEIKPKIIVQKVISLDEMIGRLTKRITENLNLSFKDFSGYGKVEKVNVIVSFLAMLELVKEGTIDVIQKDKNDIEMQTKQFDTPKYI
jgi:chromatin segregation and condensation protein Rec8/ScpA/Scc1 (kleisin family)